MHTPAPSFKRELDYARERLIAEIPDGADLQHALKIIKRWRGHTDVENVWQTVQQKVPDPPPAQFFIGLVLERAQIARRIDHAVKETPRLLAHANRRGNHLWKKGDYEFAAAVKRAAAEHVLSTKILGREKQTAARKRFMAGWTDKFNELCGQPLDEVTRVLTEVVFDATITTDAVRGAKRPTVRSGR